MVVDEMYACWMKAKLNHTSHMIKHIVEPIVASPPPILCLEKTTCPSNPKMTQLLMNMSHKDFVLFRQNTTCTSPFSHTQSKEFFSHFNCFALCITRSHYLGVNPIETSFACKYEITRAFSYMSKSPSPSNSISKLWEFPLPVIMKYIPRIPQ